MRKIRLYIGLLFIALYVRGMAEAQSLPDPLYFVENNTSLTLSCNFRRQSEQWEGWRQVNPGEEISEYESESGGRAFLFCASPVANRVYRLRSGQRYTLLTVAPGRVEVRRIVVPS